jgi:transposase
MSKVRRILHFYLCGEQHIKTLSKLCNCARSAVETTVNAIKLNNLTIEKVKELSDSELEKIIYPDKLIKMTDKPILDFEYLEKELVKPHVTRMILWREHKAQYPDGYERSRFFELLQDHLKSKKVTMTVGRKPGEKMYVDWSGDPMHIFNCKTGEQINAYLFVSCIGCSSYPYIEAFFSKEKANFINAHINAFKYYNALPLILVPDNDKSAVIKVNKFDPILNESYEKMADYYGIGIIPARGYTPKDKATVEKSVLDAAQRAIMAMLRNEKFFSLAELNKRILESLKDFSKLPFQKKSGSRLSNYLEIDYPNMRPLPKTSYIYANIIYPTVNIDYHIDCEKNYYSVPYKYIGKKVKAEIYNDKINIYYDNQIIASHIKFGNEKFKYKTDTEHMPKNHQAFKNINKTFFIDWATKVSDEVKTVMMEMFENKPVEEQAYRGALGIQRICKDYGDSKLKAICKIIIDKNMARNYRTIKMMIDTIETVEQKEKSVKHKNIRGVSYYA